MMEEVLSDPVWELIRPPLAPDDVVKLRTASRCWNVGDKYGACGEVFQHVENGPVREAHKHHDPRDKLYPLIWASSSLGTCRTGIRGFVFFGEYADRSVRGVVAVTLGCYRAVTLGTFMGMPTKQLCVEWELVPRSWGTRGGTAARRALVGMATSTFGPKAMEKNEDDMVNLRQVWEGSLTGKGLGPFWTAMTCWVMRTTASQWKVAERNGPFGDALLLPH